MPNFQTIREEKIDKFSKGWKGAKELERGEGGRERERKKE